VCVYSHQSRHLTARLVHIDELHFVTHDVDLKSDLLDRTEQKCERISCIFARNNWQDNSCTVSRR